MLVIEKVLLELVEDEVEVTPGAIGGVHEQPAAGWDREGLGSAITSRVGAGNVALQAVRWVGTRVKQECARSEGAANSGGAISRRGVHVDAQVASDDRDIGGQLIVGRVLG